MDKFLEMGMVFLPIMFVLALLIILFAISYKKTSPDMAFIVSGMQKKVMIGTGGFVIPFLSKIDRLNLRLLALDIKTKDAVPTQDCINIFVDSAVNVQIQSTDEAIGIATKNFLNKNEDEIKAIVCEVLEGNIREIVCTMKLRELIGDRQAFSARVTENVVPDLEKMGLKLVNFNVQNFRDSNGVIEDLGIDNIAQIKKDAAIAKANADKEVAIAQSKADREANDARVAAETEIAARNTELEIKRAELKMKSDVEKARADAAYQIQAQEQQKVIQTTTVNAQIAKAEREAELKAKEVDIEQQVLEAEVNKKADADRYRVEQAASAELEKRKKEAEARRYEIEQEAEAIKMQAAANKYSMEQEAEGIKARGEAEASAIQAKGIAEAEAMEKKAEAYQKYNNIAMAEMMIKVLPEIAGKIAEPLSQIDKITIIGGNDGSDGAIGNVAGNVPVVMTKLFESMKETTGVDLGEIMRASTYDAKVTRNVNITGLERDAEEAVVASVTNCVMSEDE